MTSSTRPAPVTREDGGGSIYDLGYRGYEGPRLGRRGAIASLFTHSVRTAYGLGRNARSKVVPMGLAAVVVLVALLALGIIALFSQIGAAGEAIEAISPIRYSTLYPIIGTLVMLFCAAQAPEIFGRDQLSGVLPLYFSRAISRIDYASARLAGLITSLMVLVLVPYLVLFLGRVLAALDPIDGLAQELPSLPAAVVVSLLVGGLFASAAAAVAAYTPRRSYATAAIIAIFIVPTIVAQLFAELAAGPLSRAAVLFSPGDVLEGVNAYLFDVVPDAPAVVAAELDGWVFVLAAAAWIGVSVALLFRRFRTIET